MFTEIKNNIKVMIDCDLKIEKDLDSILKEFNFDQVKKDIWKLDNFTIKLTLIGGNEVPRISLYYLDELITYYSTLPHRKWWYSKLDENTQQFSEEYQVINDLMNKLRTKWSSIK